MEFHRDRSRFYRDYMRLHAITRDCKGLHGIQRDCIRLLIRLIRLRVDQAGIKGVLTPKWASNWIRRWMQDFKVSRGSSATFPVKSAYMRESLLITLITNCIATIRYDMVQWHELRSRVSTTSVWTLGSNSWWGRKKTESDWIQFICAKETNRGQQSDMRKIRRTYMRVPRNVVAQKRRPASVAREFLCYTTLRSFIHIFLN